MSLTRKQYTLAAAALGSSLAFIDASAVIVALPTIQKALHLGLSGEEWVFLSYSLALAALYLVGGALGDRYGHRKMFARGVVGFGFASILAGVSTSGGFLISARVLQGVFGAFASTNSLAWLRSVFGKDSGKAVGIWTSLTGVSTIIAPPLGGALTQWISWRWIFYINIPLACLVLYWATRSIEDKRQPETIRPLDPIGAVLIASGFGFLTYYLVEGAKHGFKPIWWTLVAGLMGLGAFILVEKRSPHPLLPLKLFKIRNFVVANLETFLIYGALSGILVYFTLYLQFLGLSPLFSSTFLIPASLMLILLATRFGALSDRVGPRTLLSLGPALIALGAAIFSTIANRGEVWSRGSIGVVFFALGLSMLVSPITAVVLKSAPSTFSGIAAGVNNTISRIGGLTAIAVVGTVVSVSFFNRISDKTAVPLGLHLSSPALFAASRHAYQLGMRLVVCLAAAAALISWFGFAKGEAMDEDDMPVI